MTSQQFRRNRQVSAMLLAIVVILIGLAVVVAREARRAMRSPDESILLFPGFTADELPMPGHGLVVTSLQSASEAQMDGMGVGDVVLAIDNHSVRSLKEAQQIMIHNRQAMVALRLLHNDTLRDVKLHENGVRRHGT